MSGPAGFPTARWLAALAALTFGGSAMAQPPTAPPEPRSATPQPPADPADKYKIDSDRFYFSRVEDDAPLRSEAENREEYEAYNDVLLHARQFTPQELEQHANRDVTFLDLVKPIRQDYQFKLVYLEGRLKRLRRFEPNRRLAAAGVTDVYEGWMFPRNGADPLCVLTTELPPGLEPAMEYETARPVAIAGYSFKLMHYESAAPHPKDANRHLYRKAPLLMGRSFTLLPSEAQDTDMGKPWRTTFIPGALAIMGGIIVVIFGLTLWFRRGDRVARAALDGRRDRNPYSDGNTNPV